MRELKFRAWCPKCKQYETIPLWEKGNLAADDDFSKWSDGLIIEQFTGLKDKNGKEIYEGDIVAFSIPHFNNSTLGYDGETDLVGKIIFDYDRFDIEDKDGIRYDLYSAEGGEVIGNIHENKELLKGEE